MWDFDIRLGIVSSKSFVDKDFFRDKWKYELTMHFTHKMIGKHFTETSNKVELRINIARPVISTDDICDGIITVVITTIIVIGALIWAIFFPMRSIVTGRNEVVAKVIFLHLSVIHSVHRGVCLSAWWDATPPQEQTTPWDQTPGSRHPPGTDPPGNRHAPLPPWDQTPQSRHPPWEQTPPGTRHPPPQSRPPWEQTRSPAPWVQTPPEQTHPLEQTHTPGSRHTPPRADTPPWSRHPPGQEPPGSRLQHTVYERPVRILLECILVSSCKSVSFLLKLPRTLKLQTFFFSVGGGQAGTERAAGWSGFHLLLDPGSTRRS